MKDKVLLNVLLPATGRRYEFRVPYDMTVEDAARMISELLLPASARCMRPTRRPILRSSTRHPMRRATC